MSYRVKIHLGYLFLFGFIYHLGRRRAKERRGPDHPAAIIDCIITILVFRLLLVAVITETTTTTETLELEGNCLNIPVTGCHWFAFEHFLSGRDLFDEFARPTRQTTLVGTHIVSSTTHPSIHLLPVSPRLLSASECRLLCSVEYRRATEQS